MKYTNEFSFFLTPIAQPNVKSFQVIEAREGSYEFSLQIFNHRGDCSVATSAGWASINIPCPPTFRVSFSNIGFCYWVVLPRDPTVRRHDIEPAA